MNNRYTLRHHADGRQECAVIVRSSRVADPFDITLDDGILQQAELTCEPAAIAWPEHRYRITFAARGGAPRVQYEVDIKPNMDIDTDILRTLHLQEDTLMSARVQVLTGYNGFLIAALAFLVPDDNNDSASKLLEAVPYLGVFGTLALSVPIFIALKTNYDITDKLKLQERKKLTGGAYVEAWCCYRGYCC
ncbi:hypothetical protein JKP88DRAFT_262895 [Tribonema minus]|uniref:Uncharacterized protein n=1 Tax=Tribonema minus TaxID=303371 RepID=A0A835Z029_9STRA|nr:hypothetical protein JKP88DRAFT_262895 [Tribonema minus]